MAVSAVDVVGVWSLVAVSARSGENAVADPYGPAPQGVLTYTSGGRVAVLISYSDRNALSGDRVFAPVEERAEAFSTFFSYAGRYSISGDRIIHHVELASVENWVGIDLVRIMELDRDRLILRTPPLSVGGESRVTDLTWRRVER